MRNPCAGPCNTCCKVCGVSSLGSWRVARKMQVLFGKPCLGNSPTISLPRPSWLLLQINWRLEDDPITSNTDPAHTDPSFRASCRTKIYLGYTSNLISAGVREQIRWLAQHKMVDVLVTTAGGIEEDFIKCMGHTYMGDFQLKGKQWGNL